MSVSLYQAAEPWGGVVLSLCGKGVTNKNAWRPRPGSTGPRFARESAHPQGAWHSIASAYGLRLRRLWAWRDTAPDRWPWAWRDPAPALRGRASRGNQHTRRAPGSRCPVACGHGLASRGNQHTRRVSPTSGALRAGISTPAGHHTRRGARGRMAAPCGCAVSCFFISPSILL